MSWKSGGHGKPSVPTVTVFKGASKRAGVERYANGRIKNKDKAPTTDKRAAERRVEERGGEWVVYFIGAYGSRYVKIGRTCKLDRRLENLQISSPDPLHILGMVKCLDHDDSVKTEKFLHDHFREKGRYKGGEWFRLEPDEVDRICHHVSNVRRDYVVGEMLKRGMGPTSEGVVG